MKKLILTAGIILGSFTAFAQESTPTKPGSVTQAESATQTVQSNYSQVKVEELPEAVKNALIKAYPTAVVDKVFINENKEYKLQITVGDKVGMLYADANGNWIQKK